MVSWKTGLGDGPALNNTFTSVGPRPGALLRPVSALYPDFQVTASAGADVYKSDRMNVRFQIDGQNLNNVTNVIDFGGLFSGNAIGPSRSVAMRLTTDF